MRIIAWFVLLCSLWCGCTTTRNLRSSLDANHGPITDRAEIILRTGTSIEARDITVGENTTRYLTVGTDSIRQVATKDIERLRVTDHLAGGVGGFLAGGVGGFVAGIVTAKLTGNTGSGEAAMGTLGFAIYGFSAGSLAGVIYGGSRGYQRNYIFPPASTPEDTIKSK